MLEYIVSVIDRHVRRDSPTPLPLRIRNPERGFLGRDFWAGIDIIQTVNT